MLLNILVLGIISFIALDLISGIKNAKAKSETSFKIWLFSAFKQND